MDPNKILEKWLMDNKVQNKDADASNAQRHGDNRRRLHHAHPDDTLDIHGLTAENAQVSLDAFFNKAKGLNYQKLRIIHGKGNHSQGDAVLGRAVRDFIEKCPFAGESGHEKAINGGTGATWVLLK